MNKEDEIARGKSKETTFISNSEAVSCPTCSKKVLVFYILSQVIFYYCNHTSSYLNSLFANSFALRQLLHCWQFIKILNRTAIVLRRSDAQNVAKVPPTPMPLPRFQCQFPNEISQCAQKQAASTGPFLCWYFHQQGFSDFKC